MDLLNICDFTEIDRDFHRSLIHSSRVIDFMPVEISDTFFFFFFFLQGSPRT